MLSFQGISIGLLAVLAALGSARIDHPIVGKWKTGDDFAEAKFWDEVGWEIEFYVNGKFRLLRDGGMRIQTLTTGNYRVLEGGALSLDYYANGDSVVLQLAFDESEARVILRDEEESWEFALLRSEEPHEGLRALPRMPESLDEAVELLVSEMSEEDRRFVATRMEEDLISFHMGWGMGIRNRFGLWSGNIKLLASCGSSWMHPDSASGVIIEAVWKRLRSELDESFLEAIEEVHAVARELRVKGTAIEGLSLEALVARLNLAIEEAYPDSEDRVEVSIETEVAEGREAFPLSLGFEEDEDCSLEMIFGRLSFQIFARILYEPGKIVIAR